MRDNRAMIVSTTNICGTDNDFGRPFGTGSSLHRYPGTSCLATISLSLRDKSHSPIVFAPFRGQALAFRLKVSKELVALSAPVDEFVVLGKRKAQICQLQAGPFPVQIAQVLYAK